MMRINQVIPNVFLKDRGKGLKQLIKIYITADKEYGNVLLKVKAGKVTEEILLGTVPGGESISDSSASEFGWQAVTPFEQIFTKEPRNGSLPVSQSFIEIDDKNVVLLTFIKAEDDNGYIMRLWNTVDVASDVKARSNLFKI